MAGIYRFHDMLLERSVSTGYGDGYRSDLDVRDHGYYNNHLRPDPRPGKAGPVDWHRSRFCAYLPVRAPGFNPGTTVVLDGASILDITPTVLPTARSARGLRHARSPSLGRSIDRFYVAESY